MKTKNKFLLGGLVALAMMAFSLPTIAETGSSNFGVTNAVLAGSATTTALGQSLVSVKNDADVSIVLTGSVESTNAAPTATLTFARVDAAGNIETYPQFTWAVLLPSTGGNQTVTNSVVGWTNFPSTVIGSATSLKLISIQTVNVAGNLRSPAVKVQHKRLP